MPSTKEILETLERNYTGAFNVPKEVLHPSIRDNYTLAAIQKPEVGNNPSTIVDDAFQHLSNIDKNAADKYKSQVKELKDKWQKTHVSKAEIEDLLKGLVTTVQARNKKIVIEINAASNQEQTKASADIIRLRQEIRSDIEPVVNRYQQVEKERFGLRQQLEGLYRNILDAGLPTDVINNLPRAHEITNPRQLK